MAIPLGRRALRVFLFLKVCSNTAVLMCYSAIHATFQDCHGTSQTAAPCPLMTQLRHRAVQEKSSRPDPKRLQKAI
jgi:hypothetical protein